MSPDSRSEQVVVRTFASAVGRARLLALAEALAWGFAAAAVSLPAGALIAAAVAVWRWRSTSRAAVVRVLERAHQDSRNLLVTADELAREMLAAKPLVRARVFDAAAAVAQRFDLRAAFPIARLIRVGMFALLAWTVVETAPWWRGPVSRAGMLSRSASPADAPVQTRLQISVAIQPPAYTGLKESKAVDPEQLQAVEGSVFTFSIDASAARISVEHDGQTRVLARGADGRFTDRLQAAKTGYLLVTADDGGRRMMPIVVSPDVLPTVRLSAPGRDLVYAGGNPRIAFDARATDDFGVRSLSLHYTRVTGSGENYEFQEGEIPLAVKPASARDWSGRASRSLVELNLKDGDLLVYRAVASDARPGDGRASSDTFFIEISKLGVAAGDAFTLPEEESKYALSQQMLIVKTERLQRKHASLKAEDYAEQALNLAVEQRMIRAAFVFMLGGEINDEEVEAEQSVELQAGRLQNLGQRDLRTATIAMSQAEKRLAGASTVEALVAERAAVTALQRAFSRDRYILRAMPTRSQLDATRRLTGTLSEATGWRRVAPAAQPDPRTALLQDLLRGIAESVRRKSDTTGTTGTVSADSPSVVSGSSRATTLVLAEEAIRIDPASAALRQAATELQRAAATGDPAARSRALAAASAAVMTEARHAHAVALAASPAVAPALAGAFADAINTRLKSSRSPDSSSRSGEKEPR